jgi:hypothetical protein
MSRFRETIDDICQERYSNIKKQLFETTEYGETAQILEGESHSFFSISFENHRPVKIGIPVEGILFQGFFKF